MIKHKIILKKKIPQRLRETVITQTTTTPSEVPDKEDFIADTLNLLFEGMARGNQVDRKAAEALVKSVKYKTSEEFYNSCLSAYEEALKQHEAIFSESIVNKITRNISDMMEQGKQVIKKITQQIILNPPNDEARQ